MLLITELTLHRLRGGRFNSYQVTRHEEDFSYYRDLIVYQVTKQGRFFIIASQRKIKNQLYFY